MNVKVIRKHSLSYVWKKFKLFGMNNIPSIIESKDSISEHLEYRDSFVDMHFEVMVKAEKKIQAQVKFQVDRTKVKASLW